MIESFSILTIKYQREAVSKAFIFWGWKISKIEDVDDMYIRITAERINKISKL